MDRGFRLDDQITETVKPTFFYPRELEKNPHYQIDYKIQISFTVSAECSLPVAVFPLASTKS